MSSVRVSAPWVAGDPPASASIRSNFDQLTSEVRNRTMDISEQQVIDYLSNLTVMQIAGLTKSLEDKWGVKAAPVAVAGAVASGGPAAAKAEEQTEFTVSLKAAGGNKIGVIKVVRE